MIVKTVFQLMASAVVFFFLTLAVGEVVWKGDKTKYPKQYIRVLGASLLSLMVTIPLFVLSVIWSI